MDEGAIDDRGTRRAALLGGGRMSYLSEADALEDASTPRGAKKTGRGRRGASAGKTTGNHAHAHIQPDRVWLVLARREYEEPLCQIGTVEADDDELAQVYARSIYDEFAWVEMAVIPRDALVTVIAS